MKKLSWIIGIFLVLVNLNHTEALKLKVKVKQTNIYSKPDFKSQIVNEVSYGTILNLLYKKGEWIKVYFLREDKKAVKFGYIHQNSIDLGMENKSREILRRRLIKEEKKVYKGELVTLKFKDADIRDVIMYLCKIGRLSVVFDPDVSGKITIDLKNVPWDQALNIILKTYNLGKMVEGNVLLRVKSNLLGKE
jgi:hypothetical protein